MNKSKLFLFSPYLRWLERCWQLLKPTNSPPRLRVIPPQTHAKLEHFYAKAEQVNQLTAQLEAKIWELKTIATQIDQDYRLYRLPRSSQQFCAYRSLKLPVVQQKANHFVLTSYALDLFQAERDAVSLAKTLRQRTKKKRRQRKL